MQRGALLVDRGKVCLTRSGVLLAGETISDRYAVYRHLVDLGLAGPTAPDLQWPDHIRSPTTDRGILSFHALTALPAELLAIPFARISCAFDNAPVMTLPQWGSYRQRHTGPVVLSARLSSEARPSWLWNLALCKQRHKP